MGRKTFYGLSVVIATVLIAAFFFNRGERESGFREKTKIALREVGNHLLLQQLDTTSLVLPVLEKEPNKFELSFEKPFTFYPDTLVAVIESSFEKRKLPEDYLVEVIQCNDGEVAYSYERGLLFENAVIHCGSRQPPKACYAIEVRFTNRTSSFSSSQTPLYLFILLCFVLLIEWIRRRKVGTSEVSLTPKSTPIGSYAFFPDQNILRYQGVETSLSNKERELLEIFASRPNQVIKREELTKRVWEDNGVIVGRSLDTYISKLRKKLKDDTRLKLSNVHGVGYKLEILG